MINRRVLLIGLVLLIAALPIFAGIAPKEPRIPKISNGAGNIEWNETSDQIIISSADGSGIWHLDISDRKITYLDIDNLRGKWSSFQEKNILAKKIEYNLHFPVIVSSKTQKILYSGVPAQSAGSPVYTNGYYIYASGNKLVVLNSDFKTENRISCEGLPHRLYTDGKSVIWSNDCGQIQKLDMNHWQIEGIDSPIMMWNPRVRGNYIVGKAIDGNLWRFDGSDWSNLGKGFSPQILKSGKVLFYRPITNGKDLVDSDIWIVENGREICISSNLEFPVSRFRVSPDEQKIAFVNPLSGDLWLGHLKNNTLTDIRIIAESNVFTSNSNKSTALEPMLNNPCPYLHQNYDTPDWFDGSWSCGPTSCMMAQKKYSILPTHDITCSSPYSHTSSHGWYIPNLYSFNGYTYDSWGDAPGGTTVQGAHGYICPDGGAWWANMRDWLNQHNISSVIDWSPTWMDLVNEINSGYIIVTSSTFLGSYGHITIIKGYNSDHSYISNDPYGDANTSPWRDYYGADVVYDWMGYDNGHHDPEVRGFIQAHGTGGSGPTDPDTIVDDMSTGFEKGGSSSFWDEESYGWESHMWWTWSTAATDPSDDTCWTTWTPILPDRGYYEIFTHIPDHCSVASANYRIDHDLGSSYHTVRQEDYYNEWVSIGTYACEAGQGSKVYLGDGTGFSGEQIGFDAIKWSNRGPLPEPDTLVLLMSDGFRWGGPIQWRRIASGGYDSKFYWTNSIDVADTNYGTWRPVITEDREYDVLAFIPSSHAVGDACYRIHHAGGTDMVVVDQSVYYDEWVLLGRFRFTSTDDNSVHLGDSTGVNGENIAYDAIVWRAVPLDIDEVKKPREKSIRVYPNPFNSVCRITSLNPVVIYDIEGKVIKQFGENPSNTYFWDGSNDNGIYMPTGIYFIRNTGGKDYQKLLYLK